MINGWIELELSWSCSSVKPITHYRVIWRVKLFNGASGQPIHSTPVNPHNKPNQKVDWFCFCELLSLIVDWKIECFLRRRWVEWFWFVAPPLHKWAAGCGLWVCRPTNYSIQPPLLLLKFLFERQINQLTKKEKSWTGLLVSLWRYSNFIHSTKESEVEINGINWNGVLPRRWPEAHNPQQFHHSASPAIELFHEFHSLHN